MKIVVDTSVIIAVITNERHKKDLIRITKGSELVAPSSLHWEIGNAFSAMFKQNRIDLERALQAINAYNKIPIQFYDVTLDSALEFSHKFNLYAYDAYFLICAKDLNIPLLSLDQVLIARAKESGLNVFEV
jgi:predicted nucleic acid-binding protein